MRRAFNEQFSAFVEDNHLNLTSISKEMGLENSSILHAVANGRRGMSVEELKSFCKVANIKADDLIFYLEPLPK